MRSPRRRRDIRVAAQIILTGAALGSVIVATPFTVRALERTHDRYATLDSRAREQAAGERHGFEGAAWDAVRLQLQAGERYAVVTPPGAQTGFVNEGTVVRTFAAWRLLPAVQVVDSADADAVLYVDSRAPAGAGCVGVGRQLCLLEKNR